MPIVSIEDLTVQYQADGYIVRPLDGFSRVLHDGTLTLLLGPSGCGKTTLLSCLGGLLKPSSGRLQVGATDIAQLDEEGLRTHRRSRVGFVFQSFNLVASLDARSNVAAPLIAQGVARRVALARADAALAQVGMTPYATKRPGQLSGGQQQRVAVARGIVHEPEILLADEPTANLDYVQAEAVIELLRHLARPGRIVIIATHDDRLLPIADEVVDLAPRNEDSDEPHLGRIRLAAGEVLFHEGDHGNRVYEVLEGMIDLVAGHGPSEQLLTRAEPGIYFGELGAILGQRRTATARAFTDCVVQAMTVPEFRARSRGRAHDSHSTAAERKAVLANGNGTGTGRRRRAQLRAR